MKKFVCQVCGYVHEGEAAPEFCPQCRVPASKFTEMIFLVLFHKLSPFLLFFSAREKICGKSHYAAQNLLIIFSFRVTIYVK